LFSSNAFRLQGRTAYRECQNLGLIRHRSGSRNVIAKGSRGAMSGQQSVSVIRRLSCFFYRCSLTTAATGTEWAVKKLVVAVVMCLIAASTEAAFGQSGRVGWDGRVGGWDKGTGVQLIFAGKPSLGSTSKTTMRRSCGPLSRLTGEDPSLGTRARPA
jgi:hypothetical protein